MDQYFRELLEASSLGTPAARRIRSSTSAEVVDDVRSRMEHRREPSLTHAPASMPAVGQPDLADDTRRQRTERRSRELLIAASFRMKDRVGHPDGGSCPVEDVLQDEAAQRAQIDQETAHGSLKHRRLPSWLRRIPAYVLGFDFGLLLYFFAGITDVNWGSPVSLALASAVVLAAMVTLLASGFLAFTGHRLRRYKNHAGAINREDLDGFTRAAAGLAFVAIAVLAMLMFLPTRAGVLDALGSQAAITAWLMAAAVAAVSVVANFLIVAVHAFDGSNEAARLARPPAAVRRPTNQAHHGFSDRTVRRKPRNASLQRKLANARLSGPVMPAWPGLTMMRVAAVIPVTLLVLFTGLLWLLGLLCGRERRRYITDFSQQAMEAVGAWIRSTGRARPVGLTSTTQPQGSSAELER